jgi:hypothetical protein
MTLDLSLSPETSALIDALLLVPHGATVSYATLSAVIGRDVTGPARSRLSSAITILLRDKGAAFRTIRKTGLERLAADQAPELGGAARRKIRRTSNRAIRGMAAMAAASNGLEPEALRRMTAEVNTLGLISHLSTEKATSAQPKTTAPPALAARAFLLHIGALPEEPEIPA